MNPNSYTKMQVINIKTSKYVFGMAVVEKGRKNGEGIIYKLNSRGDTMAVDTLFNKLSLITPFFFIMAISCKMGPVESEQEITNIRWMLESIEYKNGDVLTIDNPNVYTIMFDDLAKVEGRANCNSCWGDYNSNGRSISISFPCTKVGCPPSSKDWEYTLAVRAASSYKIDGKSLQIYFDDGNSTLHFKCE